MAAQFPRLASDIPDATPRRRKTERVRAQAVARLASMQGDRETVWLADASTHGCSARCSAPWLRAGRFVTVALGDDPPVQAIVRWVRDGIAGLEFLRPLAPTMREWTHLLEQPLG